MSKHTTTPGPQTVWSDPLDFMASDMPSGFFVTGVMSEADARLIAAAPDLMAALEGMTELYIRLAGYADCGFWNPETEPTVVSARAAIAKAKGETP